MGMTRLMLTLAAWMGFVSVGWASWVPRVELPPFGKEVHQILASKLSAQAPVKKTGSESESEFVVTHRTEVLLNGKPYRYEEIPSDASIVSMEVAEDKKTVLKIHFRTRK
jgi:hypothetical protein